MIFSAVALVAFSFAGMANEVEKKEEKTVLRTNCRDYAMNAVKAETLQYGPMDYDSFSEAYNFYYNFCVDTRDSGAGVLDPSISINYLTAFLKV